MKLRIKGNSIRFRVSQSELEQIVERGASEDAVTFPNGARLRYRIEVVADGPLAADFSDAAVRLRVPRGAVLRWSEPEEVTIRGEQALGGGEALKLLLEKDFSCLTPRADEDEDDADLFPNPQAQTS